VVLDVKGNCLDDRIKHSADINSVRSANNAVLTFLSTSFHHLQKGKSNNNFIIELNSFKRFEVFMSAKIRVLFIINFFLSASFIYSQKAVLPEAASQFDFWVGEWHCEWEDQEGNTQKSSNLVRKILNDRVIEENFDGRPGMNLIGQSYSVYDVNSGKWKQTWVDNSGEYLDFVGGMEDEKMILSRKAEVNGKKFLQRMVWSNITKEKFDWNWERSDDNGETWKPQWVIRYSRKGF
jgi:hypothetical protein